MSIEWVFAVSVIVLFGLMVLGVPIAFSLGTAGILGLWLGFGSTPTWAYLQIIPFREAAHYTLGVLPLFILMGRFAAEGGYARNLYTLGYSIIGRVRAGLAIATIFGQAVFAACVGSSSAGAAAFADVAYPQMRRYGYDKRLALGTIAAGGTLGILIPPSVTFIIYGMLTETSVGALFIAGIIPGIVLVTLFSLTAYLQVRFRPDLAPLPEPAQLRAERGRLLPAVRGTWGIMVTIALVIGGLYGGIFTPNEAGAVGATLTLILAFIAGMRWKALGRALTDAMKTAAMIFMLVTGAFIFGYFMSYAKIPQGVTDAVSTWDVPPIVLLLAVTLLFIALDAVMDQLAIHVITLPIVFPIMVEAGYDPIWFGVYTVVVTEMGLLTPPIGLNCFVLATTTREKLSTVFRGVWWFVLALVVLLVLLVLFPSMATWLPSVMRN